MSMRLLLVTHNHAPLTSHLFSVYYTFLPTQFMHSRVSSLFSLVATHFSLQSLSIIPENEKQVIESFRFYFFWNRLNKSHSEVRVIMKGVTRAIQEFVGKTSRLSSFQTSLICIKILGYLREMASYCSETSFHSNKTRIFHILHQINELMIMVKNNFLVTESGMSLLIDLWQSVSEIGTVRSSPIQTIGTKMGQSK